MTKEERASERRERGSAQRARLALVIYEHMHIDPDVSHDVAAELRAQGFQVNRASIEQEWRDIGPHVADLMGAILDAREIAVPDRLYALLRVALPKGSEIWFYISPEDV